MSHPFDDISGEIDRDAEKRKLERERSIPFTQFLMPDGRRQEVWIERPPEIFTLAQALMKKGYMFEIEMLGDYQTVSMEILKLHQDDEPDVLAGSLCPNGPEVPTAIDKMVQDATKRLSEMGVLE